MSSSVIPHLRALAKLLFHHLENAVLIASCQAPVVLPSIAEVVSHNTLPVPFTTPETAFA